MYKQITFEAVYAAGFGNRYSGIAKDMTIEGSALSNIKLFGQPLPSSFVYSLYNDMESEFLFKEFDDEDYYGIEGHAVAEYNEYIGKTIEERIPCILFDEPPTKLQQWVVPKLRTIIRNIEEKDGVFVRGIKIVEYMQFGQERGEFNPALTNNTIITFSVSNRGPSISRLDFSVDILESRFFHGKDKRENFEAGGMFGSSCIEFTCFQ